MSILNNSHFALIKDLKVYQIESSLQFYAKHFIRYNKFSYDSYFEVNLLG